MKEELATQYDKIADDFESMYEQGAQHNRHEFRKLLPTLHLREVLDLGCGDGSDCNYYLEHGAKEVHGLDASEELLKIAMQKFSNVQFKLGLFEDLPFEFGKFDVVTSKYAIQTNENLEPIFKEVHRVLKPGGKFCFLVVHPIRQLYEKKYDGKDYFKQEIVDSVCFDGALTFKEPTHTMKDYFSEFMLQNFTLQKFEEKFDPAAEKIIDTYPGYMILHWVKK